MSDGTAIEWTDATWTAIRARNLTTGKVGWHCEHASEACRFCYAERWNRARGTMLHYKPGHRSDIEIFLDEKMLLAPLKWKKPRRIFVCSMTDLFADFVTDEWIDRVFAVMALCPQHQFQVLTKRSGRMRAYMDRLASMTGNWKVLFDSPIVKATQEVSRAAGHPFWVNAGFEWCDNSKNAAEYPDSVRRTVGFPPRNVWLGVSAEDQKTADERIPDLLQTPAAIRFVSLEPLLGAIDLTRLGDITMRLNAFTGEASHLLGMKAKTLGKLNLVIAGGESGPHARPVPSIAAVRSLRDQCVAHSCAFFWKQWGERAPYDRGRFASGQVDEPIQRFGKKAAGRLLDGKEWSQMPEGRA